MQQEQTIHQHKHTTGTETSRADQDFIDLASHDLQGPLRKLGVFTEHLITKYIPVQDEEAEQYINRIRGCINQMKSLVEDLAEYAGATAGQMQYTDCDLGEMIKKLTQEYASRVNMKHVDITMTDLPVIRCDKVQWILLIQKIVENSFRFRNPGIQLQIEINAIELALSERMELGLPEKKYYKLTFSDNGIGFAENENKKIFEPLSRLHGKSEFAGNGLGLALVKRVIENHGGIVYAEGKRGLGARIILVIPQNGD